jgi:hypothetical protein
MLRNTGGIKKGEMTADELKHTGGLSEDTGKGCVNERETIYSIHPIPFFISCSASTYR